MKLIKITILSILLLLLSACSTKQSNLTGIYSSKQGQELNLKELVKEVEYYNVIFVGDHHNTKKTHNFFNQFLQELAFKGYKLHLANEWFTPKHNRLLKSYTDGKINLSQLKDKREWSKFTKYKWELVSQLYKSVKNSKGRLYGVNISKSARAKISLRELDKMSKDEQEFYESLDLKVEAHRNLVMPYFDHCDKMPKKSDEPCKERMYRVQISWDTYMANESAKIAKRVLKTKKDKLIVFAGAMHMEYGLGIPLRFSRVSNLPFYIISNHRNSDKNLDSKKADAIFRYDRDK